MRAEGPRFAASSEVVRFARSLGVSETLLPIIADAQVTLFESWPHRQGCGYRTVVLNQTDEVLGTFCACPTARFRDGVACTRAELECAHVRKHRADQERGEVAFGKARPEAIPGVSRLEDLFA